MRVQAVHERLRETSVLLMANWVRLLEHYLVEVDCVCVHTRAQSYLKTFHASELSRSEREERKDHAMDACIEQQLVPIRTGLQQ